MYSIVAVRKNMKTRWVSDKSYALAYGGEPVLVTGKRTSMRDFNDRKLFKTVQEAELVATDWKNLMSSCGWNYVVVDEALTLIGITKEVIKILINSFVDEFKETCYSKMLKEASTNAGI